ncbi:MAG TPA: hypothetical protein ENN29_05210 [Candidatus Hydrogenedentes bacterium]|nr:hypothetical protein [Candidatus Hydrogenedentota bacterium]
MKTNSIRIVIVVACLALCAASLYAADDGWSPRSGHGMVVFQDALFLTGGLYAFEKNFFFSDTWKSTDGLLWSRVDEDPTYSPPRQLHGLLTYGEHLWLIGGQGSVYLNDVWRSSDGQRWEMIMDAAPWASRRGMTCIVHDDRMFVMGGENGNREYCNDVWVSDNGETWELLTGNAAWKPRWEHAAVSFEDALFVMGGAAEYGKMDDVWRSTDGVAWTKVGTLPAKIRGHCAEALKGQMIVFGGIDANDALLNQVWRSPDGKEWTAVEEIIPWPGRARHASTVYENRLWLAGGLTAEGDSNDVWHTKDGVKWKSASEQGMLHCGGGCGGCEETDAKSWGAFLDDALLLGVSSLALLLFRR